MNKKDYGKVCDVVSGISQFIRFVGVIGERGELLAYKRRNELIPLLDEKNTQYQFSHIAMQTDPPADVIEWLGDVRVSLAEALEAIAEGEAK